jgi:hypothetical protein
MSDDVLDADARSLLELGRDHLGPDPDTIARLRSRVETAVAVAGTATIAASIASKLGLTSVKLALVAMTVTTVSTVAVIHVVRRPSHDEVIAPASVTTTRVSSPRHAAQPSVTPIVESTPDPVVAVLSANAPAKLAPTPPPPPPPREAPPTIVRAPPVHEHAPPVVAPVPKRASLARETELVDLATQAMRANDLSTLRTTIAVYATETGGAGQLAEDIDAIEVEALCRANDPTAPQRLAAFDARWPRASQRHRLTDACKGLP